MELPRNQRTIDALKSNGQRQRYTIKGIRGLWLEVSATGHKAWYVRYQVGKGRENRKQRWLSIGSTDIISLDDAEERTIQIRRGAKLHNTDVREESDEQSLTALFEGWFERYARVELKTYEEEKRFWYRDIHPVLGGKLGRTVTRRDIVGLRDDLARISPSMGPKAASLIERILNWAIRSGEGGVETNPMAGIRQLRGKGSKKKKREGRHLPPEHLRVLLIALLEDRQDIHPNLRSILLLTALLGQRRAEVALCEGREIRCDVWLIPGRRMKNGRDHVVPLPPWSAGVFLRAQAQARKSTLFPGPNGPFTLRSVTQAMRRLTRKLKIGTYSPHDLRRTMNTEMARLGVPKEIRERTLSHTDHSVEGSHYNKYDYLAEKYRALCLWEESVVELLGNKGASAPAT